jgi:glycosyltransferase involved in cell wall biosynthesis
VRALTAALLTLLNAEPEVLRQMGENSRAHVEQHFTLDLVVEAYADIYRRLLDPATQSTALPTPT